MWSSIMPPQGQCFMPSKHQQRDFGMFLTTLPVASGKSFTNPNFVNNFNKYQNTVKPVDSSTKSYQNSCHSHIIDSIKEKCPEVIPCVEEDNLSVVEGTTGLSGMYLDKKRAKPIKRERTQRKKRQSGKNSKQRQEIVEMMQNEDIQEPFNTSTDICSSPNCSPRPHRLNLEDFIIQSPSPKLCYPAKTVVQSIEIPISNSEMILTITQAVPPSRNREYSVTDSEDSFIVFDHEGNEENVNEENDKTISKESHCNIFRKPSLCESEDSFILFEDGDLDCDDNNELEYYSESSDKETDWQESDFDDTDSSFSMLQPKKVRFASDHKLCKVHPMVKWSYAYQAARKGPWEMYARDRCRFKERVNKVEMQIKHVLDPQHRERIYKERFESL